MSDAATCATRAMRAAERTYPHGELTGAVRRVVRRAPGATSREVWQALPRASDPQVVSNALQRMQRMGLLRSERDTRNTRRFRWYPVGEGSEP